MTLQIDSLAISADDARTAEDAQATGTARTQDTHIDQLHDEVAALDADILGAIELRTALVRKLAAATSDVAISADSSAFEDLGTDGSTFSRMLARIASVAR